MVLFVRLGRARQAVPEFQLALKVVVFLHGHHVVFGLDDYVYHSALLVGHGADSLHSVVYHVSEKTVQVAVVHE